MVKRGTRHGVSYLVKLVEDVRRNETEGRPRLVTSRDVFFSYLTEPYK